jgi:hypothetical protein
MTRKEMKISDAMFTDKGRETLLNTHSLPDVVSHNIILSANEHLEFSTLIILFFLLIYR